MSFAFTHLGYLIGGWSVTAVVLGLYALSLVRRGRRLVGAVPADRRRWISTDDADDLSEGSP